MEYYSVIRKDETMPFAATWMHLEIVLLSEVSQRRGNTIWHPLYGESKKMIQVILQNRRLTDFENDLMVAGGRKGKASLGWICTHVHTVLYLKWITNKDLLYSTWNFAQSYVPAWMRGSLGENVYMDGWDLSAVHLKLSLFINQPCCSVAKSRPTL